MARSKHLDLSEDFPQLVELDVTAIRDNPAQPRTPDDASLTDTSIAEFARSIEQHGLFNPITVIQSEDDPDTYILAAGQRRLKAFKHLKRERIPAIIAKGGAREIALIENLQRKDLHPLDTVGALKAMMEEHHWRHEDLAKAISISRGTITEWLLLLDLPDDIKGECRALDMVTKTHLVAVARLKESPEEQRELWQAIRAGKVSTRAAQQRQRGRPSSEKEGNGPEGPRDSKPVVRVIAIGQQMRDGLEKVLERLGEKDDKRRPVSPPRPDTVEELRSLHKQIGTMISTLARHSKRGEGAKETAPEV